MARLSILLLFKIVLLINVCIWSSSSSSKRGPSLVLALLGGGKENSSSTTRSSFVGTLDFPFPDLPSAPNEGAGKWAIVAGLLVWTVFLLAFLGICAGDFLVVNLSTIANSLGMSEDVAGVTLLAMGNGSPDVFSTYSAFRGNSGSLAIGELLGAATFIISLVVGSMAVVKPFKVHPGPFLRDVGFALAAISLLLWILHDGELEAWEALALIALYAGYVVWILIGPRVLEWRSRGQEASEEARVASESDSLLQNNRSSVSYSAVASKHPQLPSPVSSSPTTLLQPPHTQPLPFKYHTDHFAHVRPPPTRTPSSSSQVPRRSRAVSNASSMDVRRIQFSILGALEFRDVVHSLQADGEDLSEIESIPTTPFAGGRYTLPHHWDAAGSHLRRSSSISSRRSSKSISRLPVDPESPTAVEGIARHSLPRRLSDPSLRRSKNASTPSIPAVTVEIDAHDAEYNPWSHIQVEGGSSATRPTINTRISSRGPDNEAAPTHPLVSFPKFHNHLFSPDTQTTQPIVFPTIQLVPPPDFISDSPPQLLLPHPSPQTSKQSRLKHILHATCQTLFPSLQSFGEKSLTSAALSILFVPAILALTLTLPVVETSSQDEKNVGSVPDVSFGGGLEEDRVLGDGGDETDDDEAKLSQEGGDGFNKWLLAVQCVLGPTWAAFVLFWESRALLSALTLSFLGLLLALFVAVFAFDGRNHLGRLARCFLGFSVAMIWIMTFADEVVLVLSTLGRLFGLSDAIVGVTLFAIGNSVADLVANLSIASFSPRMAFAACFGGPMLNVLLGVGLSGTFVTLTANKPYPIAFSPTLLTSAVGLLTLLLVTLVIVPYNSFVLSRRWGVFLICFYVGSMTANVLAEVFLEG